MKVRITGFFPSADAARSTGEVLGIPENGAMGLIITTDCLPYSGLRGAVGGPLGGDYTGGSYTVTVLCDSDCERFVASEFSRRGASKINISR